MLEQLHQYRYMLEHHVPVLMKLLAHFPVPRALCLAFDQARKLIGFKSAFCDDDICVGNPESSTIRHVLAIPHSVIARQIESTVFPRMMISAMRLFIQKYRLERRANA